MACQPCHPAEFATQSKSGHAAALSKAKPPQPGDWAFGAGSQAITFVHRESNNTYRELGRSWYSATKGYARTPGHPTEVGLTYRTFDPAAGILSCFGCHSTGPVTLAKDRAIVPYEMGVHCESCHGPSAKHASNPSSVRPSRPPITSGEAVNEFCGACHRMPAPAGATPNLRDPWNTRHQPLLLAESKCFKASAGKLTCFTCHSPHNDLNRDPASYNGACLTCHASVEHSISIAGRACATCHMPSVTAQRNLVFTSHRITVGRGTPPASARP